MSQIKRYVRDQYFHKTMTRRELDELMYLIEKMSTYVSMAHVQWEAPSRRHALPNQWFFGRCNL